MDDETIRRITLIFQNSCSIRQQTEIKQRAAQCGLYNIKKTAQRHADGTNYVTKTYAVNNGFDSELWYHTFVDIMSEVLARDYLKKWQNYGR